MLPLGLFETRGTSKSLNDVLVEADALRFGLGDEVCVQLRAHPEVGFAARGHLRDGTASGSMSATTKRPRTVGAAGGMDTEGEFHVN